MTFCESSNHEISNEIRSLAVKYYLLAAFQGFTIFSKVLKLQEGGDQVENGSHHKHLPTLRLKLLTASHNLSTGWK